MSTPIYKIEAISLKANKESPPSWAGSDEPYVVWTSTSQEDTNRLVSVRSQVFGDVDTGDRRSFSPPVFLVADAGVPGGIALNAVVMEKDKGNPDNVTTVVTKVLQSISWGTRAFAEDLAVLDKEFGDRLAEALSGNWADVLLDALRKELGDKYSQFVGSLRDDILGVRSIVWPVHDLAPLTVGQSAEEEVRYSGEAKYTITYRTTRLADRP